VQHSNLGWVMAKADGHVVYTYAKDSKDGAPSCTGSCASVWAPVTGMPKAGPADNFPGSFGVVTGSGGKKVITYKGYPLYTYVGAAPLSTKGNGIDGVWHVIVLSESDISGAEIRHFRAFPGRPTGRPGNAFSCHVAAVPWVAGATPGYHAFVVCFR
jgi:predicted lipoprotein with Yx(FWY)xxD motif